MFRELRKFSRSKINCEILYPTMILGNEKKLFGEDSHLLAIDISEAGIALDSSFPVPTDSFMSFYLRIEDNIPFKVLVKIRWSKQDMKGFLSGGEFIALNLEDIHILRSYVNRHLTLV